MIITATATPDQIFPCAACEVQKELGAVRAVCFDMNAACSGFLFAYQTAQAYIASGICRNILITGSERLSRIVNWKDPGSLHSFWRRGRGGSDPGRGRNSVSSICLF